MKSTFPPSCLLSHWLRSLFCAAIFFFPLEIQAATDTWKTAPGNSNWGTKQNWASGKTPATGDLLQFTNSSRTTLNNNIAANTSFSGINFTTNASAFNFSGNAVALTGGITNSSQSLQTINLAIANNDLTSLVVTTSGSGGNITLGGVISGTNSLIASGSGTLTLTGSNSYTGTTTVSSGTVSLSNTGKLSGTTNVVVNGGSLLLGGNNSINPSANLTLGGGTLSLGAGATRAPAQAINTLTLTANSVIDFANLSGTSALTFSSIIGLSTYTLSIYDWNGTTLWGTTSTTGGTNQTTQLIDLNGLTQSELNHISFYSGSGTGLLGSGTFQGTQIIPVPEPSMILASILLLGWLIGSFSFPRPDC